MVFNLHQKNYFKTNSKEILWVPHVINCKLHKFILYRIGKLFLSLGRTSYEVGWGSDVMIRLTCHDKANISSLSWRLGSELSREWSRNQMGPFNFYWLRWDLNFQTQVYSLALTFIYLISSNILVWLITEILYSSVSIPISQFNPLLCWIIHSHPMSPSSSPLQYNLASLHLYPPISVHCVSTTSLIACCPWFYHWLGSSMGLRGVQHDWM